MVKERKLVEVHWSTLEESLLPPEMELQRSDSGNASVDRLRLSLLGEHIFQRFEFPISHLAMLSQIRWLLVRLRRGSD